jgi:excisionase family DNA binding protein
MEALQIVYSEGEIFKPREVAALIRVTPRTVIGMADRGEIEGFRAGKAWRFTRKSIEDYIARSRAKSFGPRIEPSPDYQGEKVEVAK